MRVDRVMEAAACPQAVLSVAANKGCKLARGSLNEEARRPRADPAAALANRWCVRALPSSCSTIAPSETAASPCQNTCSGAHRRVAPQTSGPMSIDCLCTIVSTVATPGAGIHLS
jgi:hypothetical protein